MTTRLSNRQFAELRLFVEGRPYLSYARAQEIDQRSLASLWQRKYVEYRAGKGFHITQAGLDAWDDFRYTEIARKDPTRPLGRYFDPTAYGLKLELKPRPMAKTA